MAMRFKVSGEDALKRKLAAMGARTRGKTFERALASGGLLIANEAKRLVRYKTGTLRRGIHVGGFTELTPDFHSGSGEGPGRDQKSGRFTAGSGGGDIKGNTSTGSQAKVLVGTDVKYAAQVEFGGTIKAKNAPYLVFRASNGALVRVKSVTQPARPYMRPAVDNKKAAAGREVGEALKVLVKQAVK